MALKLFTMLSFKKEFKKQNERHVQEHSHKETVPIGIKKMLGCVPTVIRILSVHISLSN